MRITQKTMKKKILSFICSEGKFLALHSKPHKDHGDGGWFVVTGGVEGKETYEEAVKREVKEETNLDGGETLSLNWGSIYEWLSEVCEEINFIAFVNPGDIQLNEEHDKFEWLELDAFVERIKWGESKEVLAEVLKKAIKKQLHFQKKELIDYRKAL